MLEIPYAIITLGFFIFLIYVLWSIVQSLKGIDASLQKLAGTTPDPEVSTPPLT